MLELQAQLENSINDLLNLGRKPEEIFKAVINIVDMTASNELTKENLQEKMDILWSQDYNLQSEETKTFVKDLKENPNIPWSWKAFL